MRTGGLIVHHPVVYPSGLGVGPVDIAGDQAFPARRLPRRVDEYLRERIADQRVGTQRLGGPGGRHSESGGAHA
ncbi:Uncharacterised protein [Mycobacteroides abscessus subsp. massiliense]|nr:Uncharacterised protein [Mycobacteroides abscessus subsp. massiliense]